MKKITVQTGPTRAEMFEARRSRVQGLKESERGPVQCGICKSSAQPPGIGPVAVLGATSKTVSVPCRCRVSESGTRGAACRKEAPWW